MSMELHLFLIISTILLAPTLVNCIILDNLTTNLMNIPEDGRLQFCELANKYGYKCTKHNVTTEDGYILGVFHIPGNPYKPVYLQHGFLDSSDTFLIRTNLSLVAFLADQGYDVWAGNMRGNKHSRAHKILDPDKSEFWNFGLHEIAIYDVPAIVDYILNQTGQKRLAAIGQSEGCTLFYVVGCMRPEYNKKFCIAITYAPIAYLHNAAKPAFPLIQMTVGPFIGTLLSVFSHGEIMRNASQMVTMIRTVCSHEKIGYTLCAKGLAFAVFGRDPDQVEPEFFRLALGHYPCGTSAKNFLHLKQILDSKRFAQYDYGYEKNLKVYKWGTPPDYDLSKVSMKIALVVSYGDKLADLEDVRLLREKLPNVIDYHIMENREYNHIDFVWARNNTELFNYTHCLLKKYCE